MPDIADCIVDITETGRALRAAGLRIIDTILVSLHRADRQPGVATPTRPRRHAMQQLLTLLMGTLEARGKVLVKLNVSEADFDAVIALAAVDEVAHGRRSSPATAASRSRRWCAKATINTLIPALRTPAPPTSSSCRSPRSSTDGAARGHGDGLRRRRRARRRSPRDDGTAYPFHCTQIADGIRTIEPGIHVTFEPLARLGRWEATAIAPARP